MFSIRLLSGLSTKRPELGESNVSGMRFEISSLSPRLSRQWRCRRKPSTANVRRACGVEETSRAKPTRLGQCWTAVISSRPRSTCSTETEARKTSQRSTMSLARNRSITWKSDCLHTLTFCTHIFLLHSMSAHICTLLMRVTHTRMAQGCPKGSLHMCRFSPSRFVPSHVSPIFCCLRTNVLAVLSCPESAGHAHLRTRTRSLAIWPVPPSTQVMSPTSSTRSLLWTMTRCSLTIQTSMKSLTSRKTHTRTLDYSAFSQCLNRLFRTFLLMILLC